MDLDAWFTGADFAAVALEQLKAAIYIRYLSSLPKNNLKPFRLVMFVRAKLNRPPWAPKVWGETAGIYRACLRSCSSSATETWMTHIHASQCSTRFLTSTCRNSQVPEGELSKPLPLHKHPRLCVITKLMRYMAGYPTRLQAAFQCVFMVSVCVSKST